MPPAAKKQRRAKSFRGCTYCRANKKKCSEDRPACAYCVKTGHASTCTYEGLQSLLRFEWCSGEPDEPPPQRPSKSPSSQPLTPPESRTPSLPSTNISIPSTPADSEYISDTAEFSVPEPNSGDERDEAISRITEVARNEAFHLVHSWPLSNGSGFETPDLPYVHFFVSQIGNYLWFAGITQPIARYIMAKALEQPVLQHAVLCTSAALVCERNLSDPSRYLEHKQKTLALLRRHIDNLEINEGVAAAVFFMLFVEIGHSPARSHLRGLKSILDYLKRKARKDSENGSSEDTQAVQPRKSEFSNSDVTGVSPLAWLLWAWGIRMDIGLATIDGQPMIAPLPAGPEHEAFHRSWIASLSDPSIPDSAEWGLANFTLDNIMHRCCHVARKARVIRASPNYKLEHEQKIHRLCQQIDDDLEGWQTQPLIQQAKRDEEDLNAADAWMNSDHTFLHYPPLIVHNRLYHNLMLDFRAAKLYLSLVKYPAAGPNPPGSGRFQHAIEICRVIASKPLYERADVRGAEEAMCLFLAGVVFGGEEFYPMESRWVQGVFDQYFPKFTATVNREDLLGIWLQNCPCVPMVREKNFPWTLLSSLGVQSASVELRNYH